MMGAMLAEDLAVVRTWRPQAIPAGLQLSGWKPMSQVIP